MQYRLLLIDTFSFTATNFLTYERTTNDEWSLPTSGQRLQTLGGIFLRAQKQVINPTPYNATEELQNVTLMIDFQAGESHITDNQILA
jgi:hypothetical protein